MTQITASQPWQDVVAKKKLLQAEAVAASALLNANGDESIAIGDITSVPDADDLVSMITRGDVTSEDVMRAYIKKACETHEKTNCLTEVLFADALQRARELDAHLAQHGTPIGPLHGVPFTVKDQFNVKGVDSTLGYVGRSFAPAADDAVVVKMLRELGAVVLAKTNLPQSIMWCETENPLWGLTTNPLSSDFTPGGSTGGEAALLACDSTLLGWGTDIGGSIRIPSHMMGTYGFKPSSARLPYRGVPVSTEGQEHVPSAIGPMARNLNTIHVTMKHLIGAKPWEHDARCVPIPWREEVYQHSLSRPLTIGVLFDDGVVRPHPPITRVLRSAVDLLRAAGHDVVEWNAELHKDCIDVMNLFYTADGGEDIRRDVLAGGEPLIPHVERLINQGKAISVYDYWQLNRRKWDLQQAYLGKWRSIRSSTTGRVADIIIMPPMPHTAVPHRGCRWVGYTKVWNFLDYTALVIPGGRVCRDDLKEPWTAEPRGVEDEWNKKLWDDHGEKMASLELPVGLQIVGRQLEEEKVLAAAKAIEGVLRGGQD